MSMIFRELGCNGIGGLLSFQIIVCNQKLNDFLHQASCVHIRLTCACYHFSSGDDLAVFQGKQHCISCYKCAPQWNW